MKVDHQISRCDEEADRAEVARAEWIAERAAALEVEFTADAKKVGEAVADFFLADDETLVPNLTAFYLRGLASVSASYDLHDQLRQGIAPILREYATDAATDEWIAMEARELDIAAERRAAA
jgi:hypothetical protein